MSYLRVVFRLLIPLLDGRDISYCRAQCKAWKEALDGIDEANFKRRIHFVELTQIQELDTRVFPKQWQPWSWTQGDKALGNILWFIHRVNMYDPVFHKGKNFFERFAKVMFPYFGLEKLRLLYDLQTRDIILVSDCYSFFIGGESLDIAKKFARLEDILPGFISCWKLIYFPADADDHFVRYKKHEIPFHRGSSVYLRISSYGLTQFNSIAKPLISRGKAYPETYEKHTFSRKRMRSDSNERGPYGPEFIEHRLAKFLDLPMPWPYF